MNLTYSLLAIIIVSLVTGFVRGIPFLLLNGKKELPENIKFLGAFLPPAIMIILVVYCLRNIQLTAFPYGLAEIISAIIIISVQYMARNTFLSIFLGTGLYMILIRTIF